jgi:hypothetical protein
MFSNAKNNPRWCALYEESEETVKKSIKRIKDFFAKFYPFKISLEVGVKGQSTPTPKE